MKRLVFFVSVVVLIGLGTSAQKRFVTLIDVSQHDQYPGFCENGYAPGKKHPVMSSRARAAQQTATARQQLDSTVNVAADGTPVNKYIYTYDEWGNQYVSDGYSWVPETRSWRHSSKKVEMYNADGNKVLTENYGFPNQSSVPVCTSREFSVWSEDNEGNWTENSTNYLYNSNTNQLEYNYKHEIVYVGHTTTYKDLIYSRWLTDIQQWKVLQHYSYSTAEPGYAEVITDIVWNNDTGTYDASKTGYNYDAQGHLTEKTVFRDYEESTQQWKKATVATFAVCSESYTTELEFKNNTWVPVYKSENDGDYKITYAYVNGSFIRVARKLEEFDQFGNLTNYVQYDWNVAENRWIIRSEKYYEYDAANNVLYEQTRDYSDTGKEVKFHQMYRETVSSPWVGVYTWQRFTFYDSNDRTDYYYTTTYANNAFVNNIKMKFAYDDAGYTSQSIRSTWNGSDWAPTNTTTYYYSALSALVAQEVKPIGADGTGVMLLKFNVATNLPFANAAFAVSLPQGIALQPQATVLSKELAGSHQLTIAYAEDGTPQFTIMSKENPVADPAKPYQHIMLVSYKASPGVAIGKYNAIIHNSYFGMINHTPVAHPSLQFTINVTETISGTASAPTPSFTIAPNPADELVLVKGAGNKLLQVIDLEGRKVLEKLVDTDEEKIPVQGFAPGVYMLNLVEQGRVVGTEKLIIQ